MLDLKNTECQRRIEVISRHLFNNKSAIQSLSPLSLSPLSLSSSPSPSQPSLSYCPPLKALAPTSFTSECNIFEGKLLSISFASSNVPSSALSSSSTESPTTSTLSVGTETLEEFETSTNKFRTIHTGIEKDADAATFERRKPVVLELRKSYFEKDKTIAYPYTTILLLEHIFHVAKLMQARHIHLKYVEQSGDCYIMFRTAKGLVPYSTINNKHWIIYLLMHATGQEDPRDAGEGEFRLEVISDRDGTMIYTVNIVYIQGGIKLTLSPIYY